jgi:hypothetical protein
MFEKRQKVFSVVLSEIGWRIRTKDLTPTLRDLADGYRKAACNDPNLPSEERQRLRDSYRWLIEDHALVAALNHWVKRYRRGELNTRALLNLLVEASPELRCRAYLRRLAK